MPELAIEKPIINMLREAGHDFRQVRVEGNPVYHLYQSAEAFKVSRLDCWVYVMFSDESVGVSISNMDFKRVDPIIQQKVITSIVNALQFDIGLYDPDLIDKLSEFISMKFEGK